MKKNIIFITCILFLCCLVTGCGKEKKDDMENFEVGYLAKYSTREMDDGWHYAMVINYPKKDSKEINTAYLAGYNLKYKRMGEDNGIPLIDENGQVIDTMNGVMPTLSRITLYKEELQRIHDFLTEKQFNNEITMTDLDGLELAQFDKEMIVEMYNEALTTEHEFGKYGYVASNCVQKNDANGNVIQVAFTTNYANLTGFNVEYIYPDGSYLSDKAAQNESDDMVALQDKIDTFEATVIETQNYIGKHDFHEIDQFDENIDVMLEEIFTKQDEEE